MIILFDVYWSGRTSFQCNPSDVLTKNVVLFIALIMGILS